MIPVPSAARLKARRHRRLLLVPAGECGAAHAAAGPPEKPSGRGARFDRAVSGVVAARIILVYIGVNALMRDTVVGSAVQGAKDAVKKAAGTAAMVVPK
jgi:hypothetical protein